MEDCRDQQIERGGKVEALTGQLHQNSGQRAIKTANVTIALMPVAIEEVNESVPRNRLDVEPVVIEERGLKDRGTIEDSMEGSADENNNPQT